MKENYNINDIVRFAIEIEKEGEIFYKTMADKTNQGNLQKLFTSLKDAEVEHKQIFMSILNSIEKEPNEYQYVLNTEYAGYFNSIIKNTVFDPKNINKVFIELTDEIKIIDYAIQKENISIDYYNNLKKVVDKKNSKIIDKIIKEEESHAEKLKKYKKSIQ